MNFDNYQIVYNRLRGCTITLTLIDTPHSKLDLLFYDVTTDSKNMRDTTVSQASS
jgi:hypothetical protein